MKRFVVLALALVCAAVLMGCDRSSLPEEMPEDFSFALRWGTYGVSSYDSQTGKLVKTTDATHPEDYVADYPLTEEEKRLIYSHIRQLDPYDYPDDYEPRGNIPGEPPHPLYLTVRLGGAEKQIRVKNVSWATDKKGERYFSACQAIIGLLESSEAWKALPDYEVFYE